MYGHVTQNVNLLEVSQNRVGGVTCGTVIVVI